MDLYSLTLTEVAKKIKNKEVTIKEVLDSVFARIDYAVVKIEAYITFMKEEAYIEAEIMQEKLINGVKFNKITIKVTGSTDINASFIFKSSSFFIKKIIF